MEEYLETVLKKLEDRDMINFWTMCNSSFKALKNKNRKDIKKMLIDKSSYYKNKKIAEISIYVNPPKVDTKDFVLSIKIIIHPINEDGKIENPGNMGWGLRVNFFTDDLKERKFSMALVEDLMNLVKDDIFSTDVLNGINYKDFMKKLIKNKIKF